MTLPQTPSFRLDGKRAMVAGCSSGIGLACAVALAEAGAHVSLSARRADKLEQLHNDIQEKGWSSDVMPLDVSDVEAVQNAIADAEPYDILLNAAGLARHGPSLESKPEDFDAVAAINLKGAYFLNQAIAKKLITAGKPGSLITISSQMGYVGGQERAVYCATKHGVEGMTKAQAIEWGKHGIRVNTICPTFIVTDLTRPTFDDPEKKAWIMDKIKIDRVGEVEDIMGATVFLASDASALMTGTHMLLDGGWTAD